jgi:hypothetical protein
MPILSIVVNWVWSNSNSSVLNDVMVSKSKYSDFVRIFREFTKNWRTSKYYKNY